MNRKIRAILNKSRVNLESAPPVNDMNQEAVIDKINQAETDIGYFPQVNEEIYVDTITPTINEFEEAREVVEVSLENAGLSSDATKLLNIFTASRGYPTKAKISVESVGTIARYESRVALESISDVIRDWWRKMVQWLNTARKDFTAWITNVFSAAEALKSSAASLKERAASATPGSGDIEFKKKGELLINGQFPDVGNEMGRLANFAQATLVDSIEDSYVSASNLATTISKFTLSGENSLNELATSIAEAISSQGDEFSNLLTRKIDPSPVEQVLGGFKGLDVTVTGSEPFFGDVEVIYTHGKPTADDSAGKLKGLANAIEFSHIRLFIGGEEPSFWSSNKSKKVDDKNVQRCDTATAIKIAESAITIADAITRGKQLSGKISSFNNYIDAAGKSVSNLNINEEVEGGKEIANSLRSIVSSLSTYPTKVSRELYSYFGKTTKTALAYATASLAGEVAKEQTAE